MRSVSHRFAVTLLAQVAKSGFSFLAGMVVARGLGPHEYGNLAFLLGSFTAIRLVLDVASGQAFFTLSAQRPRSRAFYLYYAGWFSLFQLALPILLIVLLLPRAVVDTIWQSESRDRICLAFLATNFQYLLWPQVIQLGEVVRRTTIAQSLTIAISLVQFTVISLLYLMDALTLRLYLVTISAAVAMGGLTAFFLLPRPWHTDVPPERFSAVFREFSAFCKPLIISMALQAFSGWTEVWLLQRYAGSVAQGFFALGLQISQIGLLATASLQNIFWREVAELEGSGENVRIHDVYLKTSRALLLTAGIPIAFMLPWSAQIVGLLLGPKYTGAAPIIAVMMLYPVAQTIVTLAIVMFSVMRQTHMLAVFSSGYALLYMTASYFLLASPDAPIPGLGLGAMASGIKLTLFGYGQLLIWEYWINRQRGWCNDWKHRLTMMAILIVATLLARVAGGILILWLAPLVALAAGGFIYLALVTVALLRWPETMGLPTGLNDMMTRRISRLFAPAGT